MKERRLSVDFSEFTEKERHQTIKVRVGDKEVELQFILPCDTAYIQNIKVLTLQLPYSGLLWPG